MAHYLQVVPGRILEGEAGITIASEVLATDPKGKVRVVTVSIGAVRDIPWEARSRYGSWSAIHMEFTGSTFADSKPSFVEVRKHFDEALNLRIDNWTAPQIGHSQIHIEPLEKK
jgi:hypothetical protein